MNINELNKFNEELDRMLNEESDNLDLALVLEDFLNTEGVEVSNIEPLYNKDYICFNLLFFKIFNHHAFVQCINKKEESQ